MYTEYARVTPMFPFGKISPGETVVIYGVGYLGQEYIRQIQGTNYANLKYAVDKNWKEKVNFPVQVFPPDVLENEREARIVVAVESDDLYRNIRENLMVMGISDDRIIHSVFFYSALTPSSRFIRHTHCQSEEKNSLEEKAGVAFFDFFKSVKLALNIQSVCNYPYIRIGKKNDGGYVMLDDFTSGSLAYSFGINNDVSWDNEMAERGYDIYMYDHTITSLPYERKEFHFYKQGISGNNERTSHFATLEHMIKKNGHRNMMNMIMKMDVEGYEWEIFKQVGQETLSQFEQIVVELHSVFDYKRRDEILFVLNKLNQTHQVVHVHGNNYSNVLWCDKTPYPDTLEVTYALREKYKFQDDYNVLLPISLDCPTAPIFRKFH
ncbi:MAG: FkbM family methyltransferase [Selenomonadaceae bacterium]|nr:FkbM family methyltransferase [Selenomonadaceae bacterium]